MEITSAMVYWITRFDALNHFVTFIAVMVGIIIAVIIIIPYFIIDQYWDVQIGSYYKKVKNYLIAFTTSLIFLILLSIFLPSSKELTAMYFIPKIANNEKIDEIVMKISDVKTQQYLYKLFDLDDKQQKKERGGGGCN